MNRTWKGLGLVCVGALLACPAAQGAEKPAKIEAIAGSPVKHLTLTAKAVERLGLKTTAIRESAVTRKWVVGGEVVSVSSANVAASKQSDAPMPTLASANAAGGFETVVRVLLSEREAEKVAQDQPARVLPLSQSGKAEGVTARPSKTPPEGRRDGTVAFHYVMEGSAEGLAPGKRVRVELALAGGGVTKKIVPYGAVQYDGKGTAWAYVNKEPLKYMRHKIVVDYVEGDMAVLSEGPPAGTMVVAVGAPLLFGAEMIGK